MALVVDMLGFGGRHIGVGIAGWVIDSWGRDVPRSSLLGNIGVAFVDRLGMAALNNILLLDVGD